MNFFLLTEFAPFRKFTRPDPTGSGVLKNLREVAHELARRLISGEALQIRWADIEPTEGNPDSAVGIQNSGRNHKRRSQTARRLDPPFLALSYSLSEENQ